MKRLMFGYLAAFFGAVGCGSASSGGGSDTAALSCQIPAPFDCANFIDPSFYSDATLSYNPSALLFVFLRPLDGESPAGAAASRIGPFGNPVTVASVIIVLGAPSFSCTLPDPVQFAIWTESQCGLPSDPINQHIQKIGIAQVQSEPDPDQEAVKLTIPLTAKLPVEPGASVYVALILSEPTVCIASYEAVNNMSMRSMWFGRTDVNCDGETDNTLGWTYLATPTDESVTEYPYDLAFGVVTQ